MSMAASTAMRVEMIDPSSDQAKRLEPPVLDPRQLGLANRLSVRRRPIALDLGRTALSFRPAGLESIDSATSPADRIGFWLRLDGKPVVLQMSKSLFERILLSIDPALLAADIDQDMLPLLLEACVAEALTEAENRYQGRIELTAIEQGVALDDDNLDIALEIAIAGERAGRAYLRVAEAEARRLADLFEAAPKQPPSYADMKVDLRFRAGSIWLDLGELRRLKPGDVLLPEEDASRWDRMAATVGETWLFPIQVNKEGPTLSGAFRRAGPRDRDLWMMVDSMQQSDGDDELSDLLDDMPKREAGDPPTENEQPAPAAKQPTNQDDQVGAGAAPSSQPDDATFDELPIKLVFELGRAEMSLGRLQEIGPGHVFALDRPIGDAVEIYAGGRRIGQGEVVQIEDQIGVRMVRLFGHG